VHCVLCQGSVSLASITSNITTAGFSVESTHGRLDGDRHLALFYRFESISIRKASSISLDVAFYSVFKLPVGSHHRTSLACSKQQYACDVAVRSRPPLSIASSFVVVAKVRRTPASRETMCEVFTASESRVLTHKVYPVVFNFTTSLHWINT
jgi:hypothetical protein